MNEALKKGKRSVAYPSVAINQALELVQKLLDGLGKGPYSREEAARGIGHSKLTGPGARKVAALTQFGLLERTGNTYSLSKLAMDILRPVDETQKQAAIITAARSPKLFANLIEKYNGQSLPSLLSNILIREGINHTTANEVADIFRETIAYAGLLQNGVLVNLDGINVSESAEVKTNENFQTKPSVLSRMQENNFIFDFAGGIKLIVPNTIETSNAIADGELKDVRKALSDFAAKFVQIQKND